MMKLGIAKTTTKDQGRQDTIMVELGLVETTARKLDPVVNTLATLMTSSCKQVIFKKGDL